MPYDCFISYASADLCMAESLRRKLIAEGFTVWFDKARLQPGFDWHQEIEQGCENSRILLPVLTPRWKNSDWTKFETYGAEAVIPLVFEGEWNKVNTPPLERFQAEMLDCVSAEGADWARLFASMRRLLDQPVPEKASRISHLHHRTNDYFVGRERDLLRMHEELHCNPRAVLTQGRVRAITAMGGVGKTTLARHYAEKYWRCYPQMFWIDCRNGLEAEYANIYDEFFPNLLHAGLNPQDKAVRALHELESSAARLLILDNAEDERSTQAWIPKTGGCHTLITSRFANWSASIQTFHLYVLDQEPALQFLAARANRKMDGTERAMCQDLAAKLGYLPLALEQAAAYIEQQEECFGFSDYLKLYEESTQELLAAEALGSTFYPDSVITTWKPTVAKLTPGARTLLQVLSFMSATPVPIRLFIDGASRIADLVAAMETAAARPSKANEMWIRSEITHLRAYSMVESDGQGVSVHPLLQTVERIWMSSEAEKSKSVMICAMDLFVAFSPIVIRRFEMVKKWRLLSAHAEALISHAQILCILPPPLLLRGFSYVCYDQGEIKRALKLALKSLAGRQSLDNVKDKSSLTCLQKVANMLNKVHHRGFAEALLRRASRGLEAALGERDRDTLSAMTDLANVLADRRQSEEARDIYQRTISIQREVLGSSDPETLISLIGLGSVYHDLKEYADAENILREAVQGFESRNCGSDEPDTGGAHAWLADTLKAQGKYDEAMPHYQRALDVRLNLLGPNHPETETSASNLIVAHIELGQILGPFAVMRRMIDAGLKVVPEIWEQIISLIEESAGKASLPQQLPVAEAIYREILGLREKVVGPLHSSTIACLGKLAYLAQVKGDWKAAELFHRRLVAVRESLVGRNHQDTVSAINGLARMLEDKGDADGAEAEYRNALERAPADIIILGNIAFFRQNFRRDLPGARDFYLRALQADPSDSINHTNYAGLCVVMDLHAEADQHLCEAWRLVAGKADPYVARTLFLRAALAALRKENMALYLGQLKTLIEQGAQPVLWRNNSVRDYLQQRLTAERLVPFDALFLVFNKAEGLTRLNVLPAWQVVRSIPLNVPWPSTP